MAILRLKSSLLITTLVLAALLIIVFPSFAQSNAKNGGQMRAAFTQGIVKVNGQDTIVEILVAVQEGEDPQAKARAVLLRAYPDARPIDSAQFSTTGLVWDVFSDTNTSNNFVTVNYNPQGLPGNLNNHRNVWLASQATWTDVVTSKFTYQDGGDTNRCPSLVRECPGPQYFDGKNDVGWLNIKDPAVLGVTWYGTSTDEFDMTLDNQNFSWYTGDAGSIPNNAFDTQTVWLHEFGHGLGLGHSDVEGAVMEPFYEGVRRVLHQDDINGVSFLYPESSPTPTPTPTPTTTPAPTPTPTPTPIPGDTVSVSSISYATEGGKQQNIHLLDTVSLVNNLGNPVSGASVSIILTHDSGASWNGAGTTGDSGSVTFKLNNAPSGCYTTLVTNVTVEGLTWDSLTPTNNFCK